MVQRVAGSIFISCLLLLTIFVSFSVNVSRVASVDRVVGVEKGDWVKYGGFLALWDSDNLGAAPTADLFDVNNTLWTVNTVLNVSGFAVTFEAATHYKNGTVRSSVSQVDVRTGVGKGNLTFVSAGLGVGDSVYTTGDFASARVNSTSLRAYVDVFRQTNLLNVTEVSFDLETSSAYWVEYFWDKLTGVLVEQFWSSASVDEAGYLTLASIEYKMVDNSLWLSEGARVSDVVAPVAVAGLDVAVEVGDAVSFDGGGSRDDVGITEFVWDFGDGSSGVGIVVSHVFGRVGVFNVTLTVEDVGGNYASDVLVVSVGERSGWSLPGYVPFVGFVVVVVVLVCGWFWFRRRR